jgi:hypothetical protein
MHIHLASKYWYCVVFVPNYAFHAISCMEDKRTGKLN